MHTPPKGNGLGASLKPFEDWLPVGGTQPSDAIIVLLYQCIMVSLAGILASLLWCPPVGWPQLLQLLPQALQAGSLQQKAVGLDSIQRLDHFQ